MTAEDIVQLNDDFDDFLYKIAMNYNVSYAALSGVIMARMVALAQAAEQQHVLLLLLPHMENTLKGELNGRIH
jgi:hypothetical protein